MGCCHCVRALSDSLSHAIQSCKSGPPADRDDQGSELRVIQKVEDPKLIMTICCCPTLCDPVGCNLPDSSVHGILQARILEGIAIPLYRESSQSRDPTQVSCIAGRFFTV